MTQKLYLNVCNWLFYFELYFKKHIQVIRLSTQYQEHLMIPNMSLNFKSIKMIKVIINSKSTIYENENNPFKFCDDLAHFWGSLMKYDMCIKTMFWY